MLTFNEKTFSLLTVYTVTSFPDLYLHYCRDEDQFYKLAVLLFVYVHIIHCANSMNISIIMCTSCVYHRRKILFSSNTKHSCKALFQEGCLETGAFNNDVHLMFIFNENGIFLLCVTQDIYTVTSSPVVYLNYSRGGDQFIC